MRLPISINHVVSRQNNSSKGCHSYQIFDNEGRRCEDINLLNKKNFRRAPIVVRRLKKSRSSLGASLYKLKECGTSRTCSIVQRSIEELKRNEEPTYSDVLAPLSRIIKLAVDQGCIDAEKATLVNETFTLILLRSADFFARAEAHDTDKCLPPRAQYRALTNYWVYLIIESIFRDSCDFAAVTKAYEYSFLYPYTDDIMDLVDAPDGAELTSLHKIKKQLVENISLVLTTGRLPDCLALRGSEVKNELRIYELIEKLVSDRSAANCSLRESMAAIHKAQIASPKQQCDFADMRAGVRSMSKHDRSKIFQISVTKGVASVMPNAYFSRETITKEQAELVALIGTLGQFINDIEGLHEDFANKSLTPALITYLKHGSLDRFIERVLVQIEVVNRQAGKRFPSMYSNGRFHVLLMLFEFRLLATTALCHEQGCATSKPILSPAFVRSLEKELGIGLSMFASIARLEQEAFGGFIAPPHSGNNNKCYQTEESYERIGQQISPPKRLQAFVSRKSDEWLRLLKCHPPLNKS